MNEQGHIHLPQRTTVGVPERPGGGRGAAGRRHSAVAVFRAAALSAMLVAAALFGSCEDGNKAGGPVASKPSKLQGQAAPQFTLVSDGGSNISLSEFAGKAKVILVFYRGYW